MHARFLLSFGLVIASALNAGCLDIMFHTVEETRSFSIKHDVQSPLHVRTKNGAIVVSRSGEDFVVVEARIRAHTKERLEEVVVHHDRDESGALVLRAEFPDGRHSNEGVSYHVRIPAAASLNLESSNGRITVKGDLGPIKAKTSNGRIELIGVSGPVEAVTSNGRIEVEGSRGPVHLRSSNGRITLTAAEDFEGVLRARTSNGRVKVEKKDGWSVESDSRRAATVKIGTAREVSTIETSNGGIRIR